MFNSKFNGVLTGLLIAAIVGIFGLIAYFGWAVYSKYYIDTSAKNAADMYEQTVGNRDKNKDTNTTENNEEIGGELAEIGGGVADTGSIYQDGSSGGNSDNMYMGGYKILGTISIPKIDIKYPILEKATPKAINMAVAYLTGARNK